MFRGKFNKHLRRGLSLIYGRFLVSEDSNTLDMNTTNALDGLNTLEAMSDEDFTVLLMMLEALYLPRKKFYFSIS